MVVDVLWWWLRLGNSRIWWCLTRARAVYSGTPKVKLVGGPGRGARGTERKQHSEVKCRVPHLPVVKPIKLFPRPVALLLDSDTALHHERPGRPLGWPLNL